MPPSGRVFVSHNPHRPFARNRNPMAMGRSYRPLPEPVDKHALAEFFNEPALAARAVETSHSHVELAEAERAGGRRVLVTVDRGRPRDRCRRHLLGRVVRARDGYHDFTADPNVNAARRPPPSPIPSTNHRRGPRRSTPGAAAPAASLTTADRGRRRSATSRSGTACRRSTATGGRPSRRRRGASPSTRAGECRAPAEATRRAASTLPPVTPWRSRRR